MRAMRTPSMSLRPRNALGRSQPVEDDAFFFRIGHFAQGSRHVVPVAAIEAGDRSRALPHGGAHAIHGGIAAADDGDMLVFRVERAGFEGGDLSPRPLRLEAMRKSSAGTMPRRRCRALPSRAPCRRRWRSARRRGGRGNPRSSHRGRHRSRAGTPCRLRRGAHAPCDDVFLQLEIRDAVDEQPAGAVMPVVDGDA